MTAISETAKMSAQVKDQDFYKKLPEQSNPEFLYVCSKHIENRIANGLNSCECVGLHKDDVLTLTEKGIHVTEKKYWVKLEWEPKT